MAERFVSSLLKLEHKYVEIEVIVKPSTDSLSIDDYDEYLSLPEGSIAHKAIFEMFNIPEEVKDFKLYTDDSAKFTVTYGGEDKIVTPTANRCEYMDALAGIFDKTWRDIPRGDNQEYILNLIIYRGPEGIEYKDGATVIYMKDLMVVHDLLDLYSYRDPYRVCIRSNLEKEFTRGIADTYFPTHYDAEVSIDGDPEYFGWKLPSRISVRTWGDDDSYNYSEIYVNDRAVCKFTKRFIWSCLETVWYVNDKEVDGEYEFDERVKKIIEWNI